MNLSDFSACLEDDQPPAGLPATLRALWFEARGDWDAAHKIVQAEDTLNAAWVHAYLHRKEGDHSNAAYWYRRANQPVSAQSLEDEWRSLASSFLNEENAG